MAFDNGLYVQKIIFRREDVPSFNEYPFNIEVIKNFDELELDSPVTFLVGENGIGKSTFIEGLAVSLGLNPEGGTQNFQFSTLATHANLAHYFTVLKCHNPKTKFFLRAESFYNVLSEIQYLSEEPGGGRSLYESYGGNLHNCSHGESFIKLVQNRFSDHGFYLLDEPESALSPQRQMNLLYLIHELVKEGSQFIIATHSPILLSYVKGKILDLNNHFEPISYEDTEIYQTYKMYLNDPYGMQRRIFDEE